MYRLPTLLTPTSTSSPLIGLTCYKLSSIAGPKLDNAYEAYYPAICTMGQPDPILKPSIQTIATNPGINRSHLETFLSITDESMKAVELHCSDLATATDYCQDTDACTEYAACAKGQVFTVIKSHALDVGVLFSEDMCEKELGYSQNKFWDEVLPGYVDAFWRVLRRGSNP
ncbi:uncharacterized protein BO87DRAFT_399742 [Aspergillus neoniger CBS 115656]|uniref:Uncharacterized protein n=1 Tax=Aspergillus neoniger (strain CBS 115656) TaxID=1448310 RepID=A0A318YBI0_ASPNB|nr:hypothetical protein BO87DRAFT_399742 [Aspergillus neoniger CBS 115656]PYH31314.1 hypothetical protein BO87DRAFT_399742 [Aspergillus neoniger CBS 115656]